MQHSMIRTTAVILALAGLAACSGSNDTTAVASATPAVAEAPYNSEINVLELMVHGMDPAAQAFWKGWREMTDETGFHDLSPKTDEEWKAVEDGAAMVVIATNTLLTPPYKHDPQEEWIKWAKQTADIAMEGKKAAELKNKEAMAEIGGRLDVACDACHEKFRAK